MQKKKDFFSNTVKAISIALWFPVTVPHGLVLPRLGPPKVSSAFDFRFALRSNIALLVISVRPRRESVACGTADRIKLNESGSCVIPHRRVLIQFQSLFVEH